MMVNLDEPVRYHTLDVPVVNGFATLPDGRVVAAEEDFVRVHFLTPEAQKQLRAALVEPDSLDAAWAEAEAALSGHPRWQCALRQWVNDEYAASADESEYHSPDEAEMVAFGSTPAAALRALAAKLREMA